MSDVKDNLKKWYELGPFTIFDLETTGFSAKKNRIVEIAAIRVEYNGEEDRFQRLVNPECFIPRHAQAVHHISNEDVDDLPTFEVTGQEFLEFAAGTTLVAHNAKFDLSFLQESFFRYNLPLWSEKTMDSIPIIKTAFPGLPSYSLQNLRSRFALGSRSDGPAHRALVDAEWTLEIFSMAMQGLLDTQNRRNV